MQEPLVLGTLTGIIVLGIGAQWLASRRRLPAILLLLLAGLLVGPGTKALTGTAWVAPDALFGDLLRPITSLSVATILYEGALSLKIREIRDVGHVVRNLVTIGAALRWALTSAIVFLLGLLDGPLSLLLGAILVVTGPTVTGPLLNEIRPRGAVGPILRWEGIVIDPIGAMLAVLVYEGIVAADWKLGAARIAVVAIETVAIGGGVGALAALLLIVPFRRHWIPDFLESTVSLAIALAAFTASNLLRDESGLLTVTVMGVVVTNVLAEHVRRIAEFKETLRVLLISGLFIVLAARSDVESVKAALSWRALLFLALLILVVRPVAVLVATLRSPLRWRERAFIAWLAPRGIVAAAVSSVFALKLSELGQPGGEALAALTFMVIIATVTVYGLTAPIVGRTLGVAEAAPQGVVVIGAHSWARELALALEAQGFSVVLIDRNETNVSEARMAGLRALNANVRSEFVLEDVDLDGMGHFLALTPNDDVNTLATQRFLEFFGHATVYQLPTRQRDRRRDPHHRHRVRYLFGEDISFAKLEQRFARGESVRATKLTEAFGPARWRERHGPEATPLFLVRAAGTLEVFATDNPPEPRAGDTLLALVPAEVPALVS